MRGLTGKDLTRNSPIVSYMLARIGDTETDLHKTDVEDKSRIAQLQSELTNVEEEFTEFQARVNDQLSKLSTIIIPQTDINQSDCSICMKYKLISCPPSRSDI